jgi:type I restriction enzyme R subunit
VNVDVREYSFESDIEGALLTGGPDALTGDFLALEDRAAYGEWIPGGYRKRLDSEFDREALLLSRDLIDFVMTTQPEEWKKYTEHHGDDAKSKFAKRASSEIERRGLIDVLREGVKDTGCKFSLCFFKPASELNKDTIRRYELNVFSVVRQLHYSQANNNSIDVVLFLNGLPIFTAELKNQLNGQNVHHAVAQYRFDRDPREPLLRPGRCLAHFAVDTEYVYVASELAGPKTVFLPFNQGHNGGAGNPSVPPTRKGYATSYLWEYAWARDSVLDLIQNFIHAVDDDDAKGKGAGKKKRIFPRFHQLKAVRELVDDARVKGTGQHYLIQHSAGSGKSNTIAWLAHRLTTLHDAKDKRVFDTIIVVTDRRVLDRQLQKTIRSFEKTTGLVENIDTTSRQLREALEAGKQIIVTTLQKFPVISAEIGQLPGHRFAVIIDEAHSSTSGEQTKDLKKVLSVSSLDEAEEEEAEEPKDLEDRIVEEMKSRGPVPNASFFAFTATPKAKTLELFGVKGADGKYEAFSLYSMRQAIEEGFILDVLKNYTTYKTYWRLLKTAADDPHYDHDTASYLLRSFVDGHEVTIRQKVEIIVEHFRNNAAGRIAGKAKAMIVTRSRLHAVRYKLMLDAYLKEQGYPYKALVAFSGTVRDAGIDYTESSMNGGLSEKQTASTFHGPDYRFLVVAEKFQTGFDEPLLHTMYVDKKLAGVHAVQTLSRLNRTHPEKEDTMVLDFVNEADDIADSFQPYYESTLLSEGTDPNLLYDLERRLREYGLYGTDEIDAFAEAFFAGKKQEKLYSILRPIVDRWEDLDEAEKVASRKLMTDYVNTYAFLAQLLTFTDADLEKLYVFAKYLRRLLTLDRPDLPTEVQEKIDLESLATKPTFTGDISLDHGTGQVDPQTKPGTVQPPIKNLEPLSAIIAELNERFGTNLTDKDKVTLSQLQEILGADESLKASVRINPPETARLAFDQVVQERLQEIVESNFDLYKRVADDQAFARVLVDWLFSQFRKGVE